MLSYNPLLNEVVLAKVFGVIPNSELTNCRQVCRKWNYFSLPALQKATNVQLNSLKKLEDFLAISTGLDEDNQNDCYGYDLPFTKFHIADIPLDNLLSSRFLEIFSFSLTSLKLEIDFSIEQNVNNFFKILLSPLPFLETLNVCNKTSEEFSFSPSSSTFQETEQSPYQKLEKLKKVELFNCNRVFLIDLFRIAYRLEEIIVVDKISTSILIQAISLAGSGKFIKGLTLKDLDEDDFPILKDLIIANKISLEVFKVDQINFNVRDLSLENFLKTIKLKLNELSIGELVSDREFFTEIPAMKSLKKLAITSRNGKMCKIFLPIDYPRKLPHLNRFCLDSCRCDQLNLENLFSPYFDIHPATCPSLKEIGLPQYMKETKILNRIAKIFPAVKILRIAKPSNEVLIALWKLWPDLKELDITVTLANKNIDSVLTGISADNCMKIIGQQGKSPAIIDYLKKDEGSLADFKDLSRLKLHTLYGYGNLAENSILVTDITGYFVLADMKSLRELCIETNDLSKECRNMLDESLQLETCKIERPQRDWSYTSIIDYNFQCLNWEEEFC